MRKALTYLVAAASIAAVTPAFAAGDAAAGEKVFNKCKACHSIGEGAKNKVGPELNGIVGRPAGSIADFKYSDNIKELAASGFVWDEANLTDYLTDPKHLVPKGKMSFAGLKKPEDVANVIAYLATFP